MGNSAASHCACATDTTGSRKPAGVDPEIKERNLNRLHRIEGQVRGLEKMVREDRYCPEIMVQIASVHEALRSVGRELMRNHLRHCVSQSVRKGGAESQQVLDELLDLIHKTSR
jgi:DNA-binding FrmR family transcriptional regulator